MKPLKYNEIYGSWATLLLPLKEDESIDFVKLEEEVDFFIESRVSGIYSNGTAGEFYTQTEEEFIRINEMLSSKCESAGMQFQVGASHMSPQISLERIKRAVGMKPSAIQVILSDWSPVTIEDAINCLQRMEEVAAGNSLILYNPPHAKKTLTPEEFARIKLKVPSIQGIKVLDGDDLWYEKINSMLSDLAVFVPGHKLASGYKRGAKGAYSNVACIHPKAARVWYDLMSSDLENALDIEKDIQQFMTECIVPYINNGYQGQACDKFMAAVGGWIDIDSTIRWPYKSIPSTDILKVRKKASVLLKKFFDLI